jgi:hypothetical protein
MIWNADSLFAPSASNYPFIIEDAAYVRRLDLTEGQIEQILGGNAQGLFPNLQSARGRLKPITSCRPALLTARLPLPPTHHSAWCSISSVASCRTLPRFYIGDIRTFRQPRSERTHAEY